MRISRLDIFGFKSFVNKTSISFSDGISAIVGPNGCGKSNIVDAIRWVLGEQSPKQLRSSAMEDVIFAGSENRAPLGVAEVTLTLANGDGPAPAPFENMSEIAVTRRLYRSGESEYLINKKPCRLKDIIYFFMDTGVGTRAHSIIDQGHINNFMDGKPIERRTLVEEVAGISKFKYKKEEALRKIEHTRQNLLRVEDILGEVKRQMNSLHRQAKKADRYLELKKKLKELDLYSASVDYARWLDVLTKKEETLAAEGEKQSVLEAKIAQLELEAERLELQSLGQEKDLEQQRSELRHLETLRQDKENRVQYLTQRLEEIKRQLTEIAQGIELQEKQKKDIAARKESVTRETESLNTLWADKNDYLATAEEQLQELRTRQKAVLDELENHKMEMVDHLARETHYRNHIRKLEQALAALDQKRQRNRQNSQDALAAREVTRQEQAAKSSTQAALAEEINSLHPIISRLRAQENTLTEKRQALQDKLADIAQAEAQKKARLDLLNDLRNKLEDIPAGARALLGQHEPGIQGLLADHLEVESGLTVAVEAVLGEKLQSLLVENVDRAFESIAYLKTHGSGRSGFLPLIEEQASWPEEDHLLASRVKVNPPYHTLIRRLLKDVYWFETLTEAHSFWKSRSGQCTVVTRDGDLIDRSGFVAGGSRQGEPAGLLSRKEESQQLTRALDDLQSASRDVEKSLVDLSAALARAQGERKQKEEEWAQKQFEHRLIKQELEQLAQTEEIHERQLAVLKQEEAEFNIEEDVLTRELAEVKEELEKIQSTKSLLQEEIDHTQNEVETLEGELEGSRSYVTEAKMEITAIKEKKHHLESEAARLRGEYQRVQEQEQRLGLKRENLVAQQEEIRKEFSEAKDSLALITSKQQETDQHLKDQILKLQEERDLVAQVQAELKLVQKDLKGLQAGINSLTVEKTEAQLNIRHLEDRIRETYQTSLRDVFAQYTSASLSPDQALVEAQNLRENIARIGEVNLTAISDYKELEERHNFLSSQHDDLVSSIHSLEQAIHKVNRTSKERIHEALKNINEKLVVVFPMLFGGGKADLKLTDPDDPLESGVELYVQPPGKKLTNLHLLSGGEKALATIALLFAVYMVKPSPFCMLDEVDASLDEANSERFNSLLKEIGKGAQIILVTHSQRVMEAADILYGVTMEEKGISKLLSVRLN